LTLPVAGAPIGVFDSGMGGLTVLAALRSRMPGEDFLYLGDTARLPYGTKSGDTVARYALQAAEALVARGIKALVVACNTASSVALPALRARFPGLPVIGVVDPGAEAAVRATLTGHIAVIATEGTVRGGAYQVAIERLMPGARVRSAACQVFVALAEEGWTEGPVADAAAESYLRPLLAGSAGDAASADVLVLGCTHFPRLIGPISRVAGPGVRIVDSAATTAAAALAQLEQAARLCGRSGSGSTRFLATDGTQRFVRVGSGFLGAAIAPADVELIDL
jgi:glutamate racemase